MEMASTNMKFFETAEHALQANPLSVHHDDSKPLVLVCEESFCGLGAVLSHIMPARCGNNSLLMHPEP